MHACIHTYMHTCIHTYIFPGFQSAWAGRGGAGARASSWLAQRAQGGPLRPGGRVGGEQVPRHTLLAQAQHRAGAWPTWIRQRTSGVGPGGPHRGPKRAQKPVGPQGPRHTKPTRRYPAGHVEGAGGRGGGQPGRPTRPGLGDDVAFSLVAMRVDAQAAGAWKSGSKPPDFQAIIFGKSACTVQYCK